MPNSELQGLTGGGGDRSRLAVRSVTKRCVVSDDLLTAQSVALIVKRLAKAMEREPEEFSGRGLRQGT